MRTMIAGLALFAAVAAAADEPAMSGIWTATEAEREGAAAPDLIGHVLSFDGDAFRIDGADGAALYSGAWSADPAASPPAIDFTHDAGLAEGAVWQGIYRLEGDALTIADDAADPSRRRPAAFVAPAGSGVVLIVFRRGDAAG